VAAELPIPITGDEAKKLGKDPTSAVKFPESLGYGPDAYVAQRLNRRDASDLHSSAITQMPPR
jgi:hypothetical protein